MPCYHPVDSWYSKELHSSGKNKILYGYYHPQLSLNPEPLKPDLKLPCGWCVGCRLAKSAQWATRVMHEADLHENNCFLTLTYADEYLPKNGTLVHEHFQKFMKKLRKKYVPKNPYSLRKLKEGETYSSQELEQKALRDEWSNKNGIRFYMCGEYGDKLGRPHYHAIIFNHDFKDKTPYKKTKHGHMIYNSEELSQLWPYGWANIGSVTLNSAGYVARYIMKKQTGEAAADHYGEKICLDTGEITYIRKPEYNQMSRNGGIGKRWYEKYKDTDIYPQDFILSPDGKKMKVPKFYDNLYEVENPNEMLLIKAHRIDNAEKHADNNTPARLAVRETCAKAKVDKLIRTLK